MNQAVQAVGIDSITLESGERIQGCATVVATDGSAAHALLPGLEGSAPEWRSVTTLYFAADRSPIREAIICLNGSGSGTVNNVCVISDAAPCYAPEGQSLLSVSVLGLVEADGLVEQVRAELLEWFGPEASSWRHLRTDRIRRGLPEQLPNGSAPNSIHQAGVWVCGDHLSSASIEGAVVSGKANCGRHPSCQGFELSCERTNFFVCVTLRIYRSLKTLFKKSFVAMSGKRREGDSTFFAKNVGGSPTLLC